MSGRTTAGYHLPYNNGKCDIEIREMKLEEKPFYTLCFDNNNLTIFGSADQLRAIAAVIIAKFPAVATAEAQA